MAKENTKEQGQEETLEKSLYEVGFLLVPTIPEEDLESHMSVITGAVEKHGGAVRSKENPAPLELAYEMEKTTKGKKQTFSSAHFGHVIFEAPKSGIEKIKKELERESNVLRFLITVRTEKSLVAPAAPEQTLQKKAAKANGEQEKGKMDEGQVDSAIEELVAE